MADNLDKFGISLDLDASGLQAELIKAQNELRKFQTQLKSSTDTAEISKLSGSISTLEEKIAHLGTRMGDVKKPSADATNALTNLSRVAQDAPYGFMGIANNLNPMLESFQRLSKEAGGSGAALKSMLGALTGPAGIGLALGAVSSLIVVFGDDLMNAMNETGAFEKSMQSMRNAFEENLKSVGSTIATDQALIGVINDVSQSTQAREAALKQLKEAHKGNIELQKTDINDGAALINIINQMSEALVRKAQIEAVSKVIGEEYAKLIRLQTSTITEQVDGVSNWTKGWDILKGSLMGGTGALGVAKTNVLVMNDAMANNSNQIKQTTESYTKLIGVLNNLTKESFKQGDFKITGTSAPKADKKAGFDVDTSELELLKKKQQYYKDDIYAYKEYADQIVKEEERIALLKAQHNKASASEIENIHEQSAQALLQNQKNLGMEIMKVADANTKEFEKQEKEAAKKDLDEKKKAAKDAIDVIQDQMDIEERMAGKDFEKKKEAVRRAMNEMKSLMEKSTNPEVIEDLSKAYDKFGKRLKMLDIEEQQDKTKKLNDSYKDFAETVSKGVSDGLMTMFDAMQKGESPLKALTDMIMKMVAQLAAAVVQALIFKTIMSAFGLGGLAGGEGGGGGMGGLLGGIGKIFGFAEGGIVSRPTIAMVGEGGQSEAIMPLNKLGNMMNSTFNSGAMSSVGGGGGNGQFVLKGSDLILAMNRSNFSLNVRR
jgi:hypothetical protein